MAPSSLIHFLIVGAGAAGLMAARELARAGKKVTILEARDRCGGRIYPLSTQEFGYVAEGGHCAQLGQAATAAMSNFEMSNGSASLRSQASTPRPTLSEHLSAMSFKAFKIWRLAYDGAFRERRNPPDRR